MLSVHGRKAAAVVVEPVAKSMLAIGVTPNVITIASASVACLVSVTLIPTGHLVAAALLTGVFAAFDMIDGTMARLKGGGTKFGATLDATCDRITDGALFASILWWMIYVGHSGRASIVAGFVVLVASQVISYVKARGEASGFTMIGGLVERPERLIIALVGIGLAGFGVPYAVDASLWLLAAGSVYTVVQRLLMAYRCPEAQESVPAPAGVAVSRTR